MASASSSSYSSLLRRSKLAQFNPSIDQVYSTNPANLARANFGLKRPLPAHTTRTSPFVRVTQLDSKEGRTVFRKATREAKYVKHWQETGLAIQSDAFTPRGTATRRWDRLELQSRFVDGTGAGAVKDIDGVAQQPQGLSRMPNVFALAEGDFDRFLSELGERRDEFKQFVVAEANKTASTPVSVDEFDLYDHAQRNPTEIIRIVERFLRIPSPSTSSLTAAPLPQVHPTLALQYATPTPLESALAPPVRGRLLGPVPTTKSDRSGSSGFARNDQYASILSTVAPVPGSATANAAPTTFYPDATGVRSNVSGRASFRLTPTINPLHYAVRTSVQSSALSRKSYDLGPPTAEYEPAILALKALDLRPQIVSETQVASPAPLPGTPAYSGNAPPSASGRNGRAGGPGALHLADLWDGSMFRGKSPRAMGLGNKTRPVNLLKEKRNRRSKEEQERYVAQREALLAERQGDARLFGVGGRQDKRAANQGKRKTQNDALLDKLAGLLDRKD
ncbi:hypothetical protein JCM8547_004835 [Rhodosporidiobolus lusitaniae]